MAATPTLIEEPLSKVIWRIALPAMGAMLLRYANHAVDQYWVGRLAQAATALAAVSSCNSIIWAIYSPSALYATGLQALVARAVGARDPLAHARAMKHGLTLAVVLGVLVASLGVLTLDHLLRFQGLSAEVRRLGHGYLAILFVGLPINYVGMAFDTVYRAEGDTVTPFRIGLLAALLNAVGAPLLIRGWGPIPSLGINGAALMTVGVQCLQLVILAALHRRRERVPGIGFELAEGWRFIRLGAPVAVSGTVFSLIYVVLVKILAPFGDESVAALGLGHTIEGLPHFLCIGFATAAATLVGQNLGARRPEAAARAAWRVAGSLLAILLPVALTYGLLAPQLLSLFMDPPDPEVLRWGTQYLRVAAAVQLFAGLELVMWQALVGAGETLPTTAIDLLVLALRLPLAWLLAHYLGLGPLGVWLSIGMMTIVGALAMTLFFRMGTWQRENL
ncbi:MAG: MATE family efflux transporter [Armatimonadetes bacterium]|nr:MATE family efflux transporter [Armatimonadota bacterium]